MSKPTRKAMISYLLSEMERAGMITQPAIAFAQEEKLAKRDTSELIRLKSIVEQASNDDLYGILTMIAAAYVMDYIEDVLFFQSLLGISVMDTMLVYAPLGSTLFLQALKDYEQSDTVPEWVKKREQSPERISKYVAAMKVTIAFKESWQGDGLFYAAPESALRSYGFGGINPPYQLKHAEMIRLAFDYADDTQAVEIAIRNHGVMTAPALRSILEGGAPSLVSGNL